MMLNADAVKMLNPFGRGGMSGRPYAALVGVKYLVRADRVRRG